jgi:hypothetical protein
LETGIFLGEHHETLSADDVCAFLLGAQYAHRRRSGRSLSRAEPEFAHIFRRLTASVGSRSGTPQDRHPHGLLAGGLRALGEISSCGSMAPTRLPQQNLMHG